MLWSQTDRKCVIAPGRIEKPLCCQCSPRGMNCRLAVPYEGSLTVMMRLGTMLSFFINPVSRRLAAFMLGRLWTSSSSTYPSWPTARPGQ
jgi:hypothetical protein